VLTFGADGEVAAVPVPESVNGRSDREGRDRMRLWKLWTLLGLLVPLHGAEAVPEARSGVPAAEYRFGPGDVIEFTVSPQRSFDRTVTVQPDGKISYPVVGLLQASGLTAEQLAEKVRKGLVDELVDPLVTVSLKEMAPRSGGRVTLLGAVHSPGGFEVKGTTTVAELLASAGGPSQRSDLRQVTITRTDGSVQVVDLSQTEKTGRVQLETTVQAGDIVVVPAGAPLTVLVLGEVQKPGSYEIQPDARLLDAIALAGGVTSKADLRRLKLAHAGPTGAQIVDLQPLLLHGDTSNPELNVLLQPGDTIFVEETDQRVYVFGRVGKPDLYAIGPNDRVLDVLLRAGGVASDADLSRAVLVRRDEKNQPVNKPLDLRKIMAQGDMTANELIRPGDLIFIPDKRKHGSPLESLNLILPITSLFTLLR
jgi:polysaccharide biosynthesis/export protein